VSVLRASCDSTEGWEKYKRRGAVASLEILLHAIYYPHNTPQNFTVFATAKIFSN